jgi:hypothetical protein
MSTAVSTANSNIPTSDGFDIEETGGSSIISGQMLKFKDSDWLAGEEFLPQGTRLTVMAMTFAWVRWQDGRPEHRITQPGELHPQRQSLPDQDRDEWPLGLDGEKTDPWLDSRYVYMIDDKNAASFTFVTHSFGGRLACGELKTQIRTYRITHPRAVPIVELSKMPMKTKYGLKPRPLFKVTGWHIPAAQEAASVIKDDLDDRIPW